MKLKIVVFDQEQSLRNLLRVYLAGQGHEVQAFRAPDVCPLYHNLLAERCCCPRERPCADVVLIDSRLQNINALEFLKLQRRHGCKALDANKAVMSASMTKTQEEAIAEFGCHHIRKPFRLAEIKSWIKACAARLAAPHGLSDRDKLCAMADNHSQFR